MDPFEKYDMTLQRRRPDPSDDDIARQVCGEDNGWALALLEPVILEFDKTLMKFPNITRFAGGASTDLIPNLQRPDNPVPLLKDVTNPHGADRRRRLIAE